MPQPPPTSTSPSPSSSTKATLSLTRTDIDFPLGLGSAIIDVDIEMEWVVPPHPSDPSRTEPLEPPVRARTEDPEIGTEAEPEKGGMVGVALQAVAARGEGADEVFGRVGLREAVEARQGGDE
jgi:phosphatidylinositol-3,4,5-trisphosphate 3-phosphatase/dual-specificity protein phosphatase PTEN